MKKILLLIIIFMFILGCIKLSLNDNVLIKHCIIKCYTESTLVGKTVCTKYFYIINNVKYNADSFYEDVYTIIKTNNDKEMITYFNVIVNELNKDVLAVSLDLDK
jgi:hypothetical protein